MTKQIDLEESIKEVEQESSTAIPADFFYNDISLSALGLMCSIKQKEDELNAIAKDKGVSFDDVVMKMYSKVYGRFCFRAAMNELILAELYILEKQADEPQETTN